MSRGRAAALVGCSQGGHVPYWIPAVWIPAVLVTHYITFVNLIKRWKTLSNSAQILAQDLADRRLG